MIESSADNIGDAATDSVGTSAAVGRTLAQASPPAPSPTAALPCALGRVQSSRVIAAGERVGGDATIKKYSAGPQYEIRTG
ncbi:hypothetical protein ON010_g16221 [Phytophthora cinnamomi]|nr:hypothetical protein ON010_g16221 [Phytophthora cinnamomi]